MYEIVVKFLWLFLHCLRLFLVESVVFCHPSELQLTLYHHLVTSRWFRSCFATSYAGSLHLMCIAALKKLCNHPSLLYRKAQDEEFDENGSFNREVNRTEHIRNSFDGKVSNLY